MIIRALMLQVLGLCIAASAYAGGTFSFILDNDVAFETDREYSNGAVFRYTADVNQAPGFLASFLTERLGAQDFQLEYGFGQLIYTPDDKITLQPVLDERPYVALLYGELAATYEKNNRVHQLSVMLGVFGPLALGEEIQNMVHSIRNLQEVLGWENQLRTEPAFNINYDVAWPTTLSDWTKLSLVAEPYAGLSFGNVTTNVRAGLGVRFGPDLKGQPSAYSIRPGLQAPQLFRPKAELRWHVYGSIMGRVEAYTTLIDGNLFRASQSADRKAVQWEGRAGAMLSFGRYWFGWGANFISRQHNFQERPTHKVFETRIGVSLF